MSVRVGDDGIQDGGGGRCPGERREGCWLCSDGGVGGDEEPSMELTCTGDDSRREEGPKDIRHDRRRRHRGGDGDGDKHTSEDRANTTTSGTFCFFPSRAEFISGLSNGSREEKPQVPHLPQQHNIPSQIGRQAGRYLRYSVPSSEFCKEQEAADGRQMAGSRRGHTRGKKQQQQQQQEAPYLRQAGTC